MQPVDGKIAAQSSIRMYFATKKTDAKMLPTMKASFFENAY
jgi:hypothetical protein